MPRNGSGVYSPTAGIPVVSGTTISSTAVNNVLDDLGDEITASLPVSGVAPMTGVLRVTAGTAGAPGLVPVGDTNTGIYSPGADQLGVATGGVAAVTFSATQTTSWAGKAIGKTFDVDAITTVASATTTDIGAAATSEVRITGTTTITSFGTSNAGIRRRGRFADALTLTHNGTSLILPGAANITTAANDAFEAVSLGSGNWQVTNYTRAGGGKLVAQVVNTTSSALVPNTGPTAISLDDTIPQNTEGTEFLTVAITPTNAASTLIVEISAVFAVASAANVIGALFQDSTANAIAAVVETAAGANHRVIVNLRHTMTAGTTSATTFRFRAGPDTAIVMEMNGTGAGARMFGGVCSSSITITEVLP
jgi:hypothetical protein